MRRIGRNSAPHQSPQGQRAQAQLAPVKEGVPEPVW